MIILKRIYEPAQKTDGYRVLVDRLWPRGVAKEVAHIDLWLRDIAPSDALRKWFGHDPKKWEEFKKKYKEELKEKKELLDQLKQKEKQEKTICLLYGAKDTQRNNAQVLKEILI